MTFYCYFVRRFLMKKIMFTAVCATALALGAFQLNAQQNPAQQLPNGGGLFEQLNLTAEQQQAYQKIKDNSKEKMIAVRKEMQVYVDKLDAIRAEENAEFEKLLTPEQTNILEQMKAERKAIEDERKARMEEMRKRYEAERAAKK